MHTPKTLTRLCLAAGLVLAAGSPPHPRAADAQELVLRVVWDESGSNGNGSWKAKYDSRFRPSAIWNGSAGGAIQVGGKWKTIGGGSSPEFLYKLRGSLLGLEVGEKLQYYLSEANDAGTELSGSPPTPKPMSASLTRDGVYAFSGADGSYTEDDARYRKREGIPKNANFPAVGRAYHWAIDLERTKDGVTIVLGAGAGGRAPRSATGSGSARRTSRPTARSSSSTRRTSARRRRRTRPSSSSTPTTTARTGRSP